MATKTSDDEKAESDKGGEAKAPRAKASEPSAEGGSRTLLMAVGMLAVGFAAGYMVGKSSAPEPLAAPPPTPAFTAENQVNPAPAQSAAPAASGGKTSTGDAPAEAGPEAIALLDGLKKGDKVGLFTVNFIGVPKSGVMAGSIAIGLKQNEEDKPFVVSVATKGSLSYQANFASEQYAFFYSAEATDAGASTLAKEREDAVNAIVERVKKTEATVPKPPGM